MINGEEFTQETLEKIKEYTLIHSKKYIGKDNARRYTFFAEEATSTLCELLMVKEVKNIKNVDGYLFTAAKNVVLNTINKHNNVKKRSVFLEYNNLNLDVLRYDTNDEHNSKTLSNLDIEEESLEEKIQHEMELDNKVAIIIQTILNNDWVDEYDTDVFIERFINGHTIKGVADVLGLSYSNVKKRLKRIKNILNYMKDQSDSVFIGKSEEETILNNIKNLK